MLGEWHSPVPKQPGRARAGAQHDGAQSADDALDLRGEYKGLLTDAILRLFRDLRPLLAAR